MGYYRRSSRSAWPEYESVAEKKLKANKTIASLQKKGEQLHPVVIEGRLIAKTFWGKSWCKNLESYSDYANRLPRGRSYVRNGSVVDLQISQGLITAQVAGSSLYKITIKIQPMISSLWKELVTTCTGKIDSLIELLQGKFSKGVMEVFIEKDKGLFPKPKEISIHCSCPDSASMCKHIAAVLYGVGAVLDNKPEHLFTLRQVDPSDLLASATTSEALLAPSEGALQDEDLSSLFGIEMEEKVDKVPVSKKKKTKKQDAKE